MFPPNLMSSRSLTSTGTWGLIAVAISACWCAWASSEQFKRRREARWRADPWPPPAEFFKGSPIRIAPYLQKWFRFNLQE